MPLTDVKYVTAGPWGAGEDRPLTANEVDTNFKTLVDGVQALIDNPPEGVFIVNVTVEGSLLTFVMSDATTYGPFELPVASLRPVGEWAPSTAYYSMDIVQVSSGEFAGTYLVIANHTSDLAFDPAAVGLDGELYFQLGGYGGGGSFADFPFDTTTLTLDASSVGTYRKYWGVDQTVITVSGDAGFTVGQEVIFYQANDGNILIDTPGSTAIQTPVGFDWQFLGTQGRGQGFKLRLIEVSDMALWSIEPIGIVQRDIIYPITDNDVSVGYWNDTDYYNMVSAAPHSVLLPVSFPKNGTIMVRQGGAGIVTILGESGTTLSHKATRVPETAELGDVILCKHAGDGVWFLSGDLAPV